MLYLMGLFCVSFGVLSVKEVLFAVILDVVFSFRLSNGFLVRSFSPVHHSCGVTDCSPEIPHLPPLLHGEVSLQSRWDFARNWIVCYIVWKWKTGSWYYLMWNALWMLILIVVSFVVQRMVSENFMLCAQCCKDLGKKITPWSLRLCTQQGRTM
jgi:hypothetical protein